MKRRREVTRRGLVLEGLERRVALSTGFSGAALPISSGLRSIYTEPYVAVLGLASKVPASDPATGSAVLQLSHRRQINVSGSLSHISNVSAVVLQLTVPSSTTANQTVAVLLKPGSGSGAVRHRTFHTAITEISLIGPLVGRPLAQLFVDMRLGLINVVVQTNNGVDPSSSMQPGNFPTGELQGTLKPAGSS